jgi:hypothetical protein
MPVLLALYLGTTQNTKILEWMRGTGWAVLSQVVSAGSLAHTRSHRCHVTQQHFVACICVHLLQLSVQTRRMQITNRCKQTFRDSWLHQICHQRTEQHYGLKESTWIPTCKVLPRQG